MFSVCSINILLRIRKLDLEKNVVYEIELLLDISFICLTKTCNNIVLLPTHVNTLRNIMCTSVGHITGEYNVGIIPWLLFGCKLNFQCLDKSQNSTNTANVLINAKNGKRILTEFLFLVLIKVSSQLT